MKSYLALLGTAAQLGWGLVAPGPSPTDTATDGIDLHGITPKPTTVAILHPGLAKRQPGQSLLGWAASDSICGYVSGSLGAVKSCETTEICAAVNIGAIGKMGCCNESDCTWLGDCVDSANYATECGQASFPLHLRLITGYRVPGINVGFYSCDSVSQTGTFDAFLTTFKGETDIRTWKALYDTDTSIGSSKAKIQTSSLGASDAFGTGFGDMATTTTNTGAAGTGSGSTSKTTTKTKKSIGPIIGGIVGGIAVIGAIIAGVIIALMKKRKNNASTATALRPTNMNNAPPAGPDMRQSMYSQASPPQGPYPQSPYPQQQQQQYPQQYQEGQQFKVSPNPGSFATDKADQNYYVKQDGGAQITEQSVPITPLPPTSPAPPYMQPVQQGRESWNVSPPAQSPPPQMMQQGSYQGPQLQSQGPAPVELGTNASMPQRNTEGRPVYEAA
ncbi:hypothetical protein E2P81_ATG03300 [Venturia nashicola]|uniref:Uncharacterized protein n=1 Tax=Venturia nashicola TaxID=86259 RepID=A0A4Z1P4H8_9PEZI|nr:hypothetical protein E6O75_ATG03369 [Venturia nashicola]TLD36411.1 hypothetical protein E2P81_ATG03300 [Venturia nashicola]